MHFATQSANLSPTIHQVIDFDTPLTSLILRILISEKEIRTCLPPTVVRIIHSRSYCMN